MSFFITYFIHIMVYPPALIPPYLPPPHIIEDAMNSETGGYGINVYSGAVNLIVISSLHSLEKHNLMPIDLIQKVIKDLKTDLEKMTFPMEEFSKFSVKLQDRTSELSGRLGICGLMLAKSVGQRLHLSIKKIHNVTVCSRVLSWDRLITVELEVLEQAKTPSSLEKISGRIRSLSTQVMDLLGNVPELSSNILEEAEQAALLFASQWILGKDWSVVI